MQFWIFLVAISVLTVCRSDDTFMPLTLPTAITVWEQTDVRNTQDYFNGSFLNQSDNEPVSAKFKMSFNLKSFAVDKSGGIYMVGFLINQVSYFEPGNASAPSRVYGRGTIETTHNRNATQNFNRTDILQNYTILGTSSNLTFLNPTADSLNDPTCVAVDDNYVYIGDNGNRRVLVYAGESTTAFMVYGQYDFNTSDVGMNASFFSMINSISIANGLLYVADGSRVLSFALPPNPVTTTTTSSTLLLDSASSTPLSTGAIVGISVGGAVGVTAIAVFVYFKFGSSAAGYFTYK